MPGVSRRTALLSATPFALAGLSACSSKSSSTKVSNTTKTGAPSSASAASSDSSSIPTKNVPMPVKAGQLLSDVHYPNNATASLGNNGVTKGSDPVALSNGSKISVSVIQSYGNVTKDGLSFNPPNDLFINAMQPQAGPTVPEPMNFYEVPNGLTAIPVACLSQSASPSSSAVSKVVASSASQPGSGDASLAIVTNKRTVDLSLLLNSAILSDTDAPEVTGGSSNDVVFIPTNEVDSAHFVVTADGKKTKISLLGKRL